MKFEIKNRFSSAVQVVAEIECDESASYSVKLGLAAQWAYKAKAYLRGADLGGANLRGADLGGLILIARATRSDGHEYRAWTSALGGMVITAGCRTWQDGSVLTPGMALTHAVNHSTHTTDKAYRAEALAILAHIERMVPVRMAQLAETKT